MLDVPLFFINQEQAGVAARQALTDLGEEHVSVDEADLPAMPTTTGIIATYPNPFNSVANIRYQVSSESHLKIAIYNLLGQEIEVLWDGNSPPGEYSISWDVRNCPSGIYFCRITAGGISEAGRMILIK